MLFSPTPPAILSVFGITTLFLIAALLFLSLVSLAFILHLSLLSRCSPRLRRFTSLSRVRSFLVFLIILWSLNETLRLPSLRRRLSPLILPASSQTTLCKFHVVLSFGLLEPTFLLTLLFLVEFSIRKKFPRGFLTVTFILGCCLPFLVLHIFFLFFSHLEGQLPEVFFRSWQTSDSSVVFCGYPLASTAIFALFLVIFLPSFSVSCWRVVLLVINRGLRRRICALALTMASSLVVEILVLGLLMGWSPDEPAYESGCLIVFLCTLVRAAMGEGILVIKPIVDSLAAEGESTGKLVVESGGEASSGSTTEISSF